jgi:quinol monooxygenase YgiN
MITRFWRGIVRTKDADSYMQYLETTGLKDISSQPGNRSVEVWRRELGKKTEFAVVSKWKDRESIRSYVGHCIDMPHYYPQDEKYLLFLEPKVGHFESVQMCQERDPLEPHDDGFAICS